MGSRIDLQNMLDNIEGNTKAYYQPPSSLQISYPCFIYSDKPGNILRASDTIYRYKNRYDLLYITKTPRQDMMTIMLEKFSYCSLDNIYISDGLHHYAFTIYY